MTIRNLPLLGSLFLSGLLALGACGSSSSSSGTGGTTGTPGGTTGTLGGHVGSAGGSTGTGGQLGGLGGSTGTGAGGASGACSTLPPCLTFISNCLPSGSCVTQTTSTGATSQTINNCYSNGVKESDATALDLATLSYTGTITYSKGNAVCFSESVAVSGAGGSAGAATGSATIKNGSGATVATLTPNADGTYTVACTGGSSYVITDNTCMPSGSSSATSDCTDGVCQ